METERQNDSWKKDKMVVSWEEAGIIWGKLTISVANVR